jgi:hypothetical protein
MGRVAWSVFNDVSHVRDMMIKLEGDSLCCQRICGKFVLDEKYKVLFRRTYSIGRESHALSSS